MASSPDSSAQFCEKSFQKAVKIALRNLENCSVEELSGPQKNALRSFIAGKDTFACLPTGHGKSLIYQLSVRVTKQLLSCSAPPVVLVISPLNSLIADQLRECERIGIKACKLDSSKVEELATRCDVEIMFSSPEVLESLPAKIFLQNLEKRLVGIVVDESHCVVNW